MSIIDTLVYDRSAADTVALESLFAKAKAGSITDEEWAILADPANKGAYNYTDLNRVNAATDYLAARLRGYGYAVVGHQSDGRAWTGEDIPTPAQMAQYVMNAAAIRSAVTVLPTTPAVPDDMDDLTVEEANAIEKILADVEAQLVIMATTFIPCGEALCGGDNL